MNSTLLAEVLTLEEAATYLKLPTETLLRQAIQGTLPGRNIDNTWRFLKTAINDWLTAPNNRMLLLQQAGALTDDPTLADLRVMIYAQRERPEVEGENTP